MIRKILYISTRGTYDLKTGEQIKKNSYALHPANFFQTLDNLKEITIVIHGLRNTHTDAKNKFQLARNRLKKIGYSNPVIGFSYDSNTKGAHLKKCAKKSLQVGKTIAKKNGPHLGKFILDLKKKQPQIQIRLMGHSLGTEVILNTIIFLAKKPKTKNIIKNVYFFGSSVTNKSLFEKNSLHSVKHVVENNLINYYATNDEVLQESVNSGLLEAPLGLYGFSHFIKKLVQKKVFPQNHRFASYLVALKKFP